MPLLAAGVLLIALTWLSFRGLNLDAQRFDRALQSLDHFGLVERAVQRDILRARVGLLRNYDPLVRETDELRDALNDLCDATLETPRQKAATDRLVSLIGKQEDYTEQLKSKIALLRNSLTYFGLFSSRLSTAEGDNRSLPAVNAVSASILRLTLDTSTANSLEVEQSLRNLDKELPIADDPDTVKALLAHGYLLHNLLPETDRILAAIFALPLKANQEDLHAILTADQLASREEAREFRVLVFSLSLLLLGILIQLGFQLGARARSLRWRAAVEHVIADISTSLIDCPTKEMSTRLNEALHRLAECVGADRAYFIYADDSRQTYSWCGEDSPFTDDWPGRSVGLARRFLDETADGVIHIPMVSDLAPNSDKDSLGTFGMQSWVCLVSRKEAAIEAILGFDTLKRTIAVPPSDLRLLRMAFDAILSAIGRDRLARESAHLEEQLHQARRMQTIGAFASGVAHNFNNIIAAILGYVEISEQHIQIRHPAARSLSEIRRAGIRARNLVEQLLAFGRRRPSQREALRLDAVVAEAHSLLSASLPAEVQLVVHKRANAVVLGEPAQLQQVILNLCHNAVQAMDEKGRVEIGTEVHDIHDTLLTSHAELPQGRYAVISVKDTGRGMTPAIMSQLFEPFFTTRPTGNGLGLATASEIIRGHGGAINVRSEPNVGSCFEAWIPCHSPAQTLRSTDRSKAFLSGHGQTVLVVEEPVERLLRDEEVLAALGYEPVGFLFPSDAVAACKADPNRFDAFLIGYLTPVSAALSVASVLRRIAPDKPLLIAMPSARKVDTNSLISSGISQIVRWPLVPGEIAAALTQSFAIRHAVRSPDHTAHP
jgi:signal transduction histidine kinase